MATGTNGIATEGEAKSKLGYSGTVDTNKCCTKARAIAMGADSSRLGNYSNNQLVKYSDIVLNSILVEFFISKSTKRYYAQADGYSLDATLTYYLEDNDNSNYDGNYNVVFDSSDTSNTYTYPGTYPVACNLITTEVTVIGVKYKIQHSWHLSN